MIKIIVMLDIILYGVAYEILGDPRKRRSYDSVDPTFSDVVPPVSTHSKENFYEVFGPVFRDNARFDSVVVWTAMLSFILKFAVS